MLATFAIGACSRHQVPSLCLSLLTLTCWAQRLSEHDDLTSIAIHLQVGQNIEQTYAAELLWIDKQGVYLSVLTASGDAATVCRVTFHRPVLEERDARSVLTLLAQVAWERERSYVPAVPATSTS